MYENFDEFVMMFLTGLSEVDDGLGDIVVRKITEIVVIFD